MPEESAFRAPGIRGPKIDPGLSLEDRLEALPTADINKDLGRRIMLRTELAAFLRNHDDRSAHVKWFSVMRNQGTPRELLANHAGLHPMGETRMARLTQPHCITSLRSPVSLFG